MTNEELKELLRRYSEGNCTPEETQAVNLWADSIGEGSDFVLDDEESATYYRLIREQIKENTGLTVGTHVPQKRKLFIGATIWRVAAVILLVFGCSYFFFIRKNNLSKEPAQTAIQDIPPGGNHAYLTLADGRKISLDSIQNGNIVTDGTGTITKQQNGQLAYQTKNKNLSTAVAYNTLSTPKGGQYRLTLSDGTLVKLNAGSSIRYPVSFTGKDRTVYITGEAYFEVEHNIHKPFRVVTAKTIIEDIGTVFDVNAYEDEPAVKTTLSEGAVKVANKTLVPGEQATVDNQTGNIKIEKTDVSAALAWTKGLISANDIDLQELMKQLSRWYDVEIRYQGKVPSIKVGGIIGRNTNLSNILTVLSANGIHAKLENRTIIVSP